MESVGGRGLVSLRVHFSHPSLRYRITGIVFLSIFSLRTSDSPTHVRARRALLDGAALPFFLCWPFRFLMVLKLQIIVRFWFGVEEIVCSLPPLCEYSWSQVHFYFTCYHNWLERRVCRTVFKNSFINQDLDNHAIISKNAQHIIQSKRKWK